MSRFSITTRLLAAAFLESVSKPTLMGLKIV